MKQAKGASHIRELLMQRGFDIPSRSMTLDDNQRWTVFERDGRQVGVDPASGIWLRESEGSKWRCVAKSHTMSGVCLAVDFLTRDQPLPE